MRFNFAAHCLPVAAFAPLVQVPQRADIPPHSLFLLSVQSGHCSLRYGQGSTLGAGAGSFAAFDSTTEILPLAGFAAEGLVLAGSAAADFSKELKIPLVLPAADVGLQALFRQMMSWHELAPAEASALAYSLLCRLAVADAKTCSLSPLVAGAVSLIQENYAEVYGVEELADTLMVSKSHLIRSFTAALGISPGRYLTTVRLENAKSHLLRGEYSLEVIANLCGFSGANYFCKVFKKEMGETPASWRSHAKPQVTAQPPSELENQMYL